MADLDVTPPPRPLPKPPRRLPCLVDPDCPLDRLNRKRKGARRG